MKHFFFILFAIVLIVTGIFLPYMHGDYDNSAVGLSYVFQFGVFASLLLIPTGVIWLVVNFSDERSKHTAKCPPYIRKTALVITIIIVLAAAIGAMVSNSRSLAIVILGIAVFLFTSQKKINLQTIPNNIIPYYFIIIPLVVAFVRLTYFEKAKNNATDFVIKQSEPLLKDIESYKLRNGHYPVSILSTIEDYHPSVLGVPRFHYELNGNSFNLYFEQFSSMIGTQEIVMYNKLDEQEMTVHNQDLLRIPYHNISHGHHKVVDHPQPNWKIFYFD